MRKKQKYRWNVSLTDGGKESFNGFLIKVKIQDKFAEFKESNGQPRIYFNCEKIFGVLLNKKLTLKPKNIK